MNDPRPRLRLLKVVTQATFVLDDGETLSEITTDPVTVTAADWADYATRQFAEATAALAEEFDAFKEDPNSPR